MPPGDWAKVSTTARRHHWSVDTPGKWTMVLTRATRSLTLYFESDDGTLMRALYGPKEVGGTPAVLMSRVLRILRE